MRVERILAARAGNEAGEGQVLAVAARAAAGKRADVIAHILLAIAAKDIEQGALVLAEQIACTSRNEPGIAVFDRAVDAAIAKSQTGLRIGIGDVVIPENAEQKMTALQIGTGRKATEKPVAIDAINESGGQLVAVSNDERNFFHKVARRLRINLRRKGILNDMGVFTRNLTSVLRFI